MRVICLARKVLILFLVSAGTSPQTLPQEVPRVGITTPSPHASASQERTRSSIEGLVVRLGTSEPIRKAHVDVAPVNGGGTYRRLTDASGRFVVDGIEPGRYKIRIHKVGYVGYLGQDYGEDATAGSGESLTVHPGENISDLLFRMVPEGVISGRIADEDGAPVVDASVTALLMQVRRGQRKLFAIATVQTNDLGEYRLYDLRPGRYYVRAARQEQYVKEKKQPKNNDAAAAQSAYTAVFYPGTSEAKDAIAITVPPGQEVPLGDMILVPTSAVRLRGHVFNAISGKPLTGCCVFLELGGGVVLDDSGPGRLAGPDGAFEIDNVVAGSFVLRASALTDGKWHDARLPIEVGNVGLNDLNLTIFPEVTITGRVAIEGSESVRLSTLHVVTEELECGFCTNGRPADVKTDGTFQLIDLPPGKYQVRVQGGPPAAYLKSVHFQGESSPDNVLNVHPGAKQGPLEILLNPAGCQVDGSVTDRDGLPLPHATVVLVPDKQRRQFYSLYKDAKTDQAGDFILTGIAPGDYEVFAWNDIDNDEWEDPDFLGPLEPYATRVNDEDCERKSISLKVIQWSER
ncbi:MAG TPA: carboxypeptidase-like regulatory domain-containing protein [Verrucomicrobiae bacterium]|nr:carboxypeptidase-like regulatory domain-containing protein [Verrucomicrobiae bacterium]